MMKEQSVLQHWRSHWAALQEGDLSSGSICAVCKTVLVIRL